MAVSQRAKEQLLFSDPAHGSAIPVHFQFHIPPFFGHCKISVVIVDHGGDLGFALLILVDIQVDRWRSLARDEFCAGDVFGPCATHGVAAFIPI